MIFLPPDELARLTGLRRPSAQCRWLSQRGWRFEVDRWGRPVVLIQEAERPMLSGPVKREPKVRVASL